MILGLWNMGESQGFHDHISPRECKNIIKACYRSGIRSFDTAYSYQEADSMLASAMKEAHISEDQYEVTSKIMPLDTMEKKAETGLRRLSRSYYDTLLLHWPTEERLFKSLKTLERLQSTGKARRIGVSNFPIDLIEKVRIDFPISVHQRAYNPLWTRDIDKERLPLMLYSPFAFGCLLKDSIPEDRRKDLFFYRKEALPCFLNLRYEITRIAEKKGSSELALLISFASRKGEVVFGTSSEKKALELAGLVIPELTEEEENRLKEAGRQVEAFSEKDNIFSHIWR